MQISSRDSGNTATQSVPQGKLFFCPVKNLRFTEFHLQHQGKTKETFHITGKKKKGERNVEKLLYLKHKKLHLLQCFPGMRESLLCLTQTEHKQSHHVTFRLPYPRRLSLSYRILRSDCLCRYLTK